MNPEGRLVLVLVLVLVVVLGCWLAYGWATDFGACVGGTTDCLPTREPTP